MPEDMTLEEAIEQYIKTRDEWEEAWEDVIFLWGRDLGLQEASKKLGGWALLLAEPPLPFKREGDTGDTISDPRDYWKELRVGDLDDSDGATRKVVIVAETTDGRYVCRRGTSEVRTRPWDGSQYTTQNFSPLFLVNKEDVKEG